MCKGDLYSMRMSASSLFSKSYLKTNSDERKEKLKTLFFELCGDDTPMVRRAAATALAEFAKALGDPTEPLIETYKKLLKDPQDAVKTETIKCSVIITQMLMSHEEFKLEETIIEAIEECIKGSGSWRLRFAVAEILPSLAETAGKKYTDEHFVGMLEKLIEDSEAEVRSEALNAIPKVGKICTPNLIIAKLIIPISTTIVGDQSVHVRASLAEAICKIGEIVGGTDCIDHIVPILKQVIKDQHTEV